MARGWEEVEAGEDAGVSPSGGSAAREGGPASGMVLLQAGGSASTRMSVSLSAAMPAKRRAYTPASARGSGAPAVMPALLASCAGRPVGTNGAAGAALARPERLNHPNIVLVPSVCLHPRKSSQVLSWRTSRRRADAKNLACAMPDRTRPVSATGTRRPLPKEYYRRRPLLYR